MDEECCPRFDPEPWDEKVIEWKDKKFVKDHVFTLFHISSSSSYPSSV